MIKIRILAASALAACALSASPAKADDAEIIKNAEAAAPAAVSSKAKIVAMDANGKMRTVREGSNGFWCMPDDPSTPSNDPMCGDENAMDWLMAVVGKGQPTPGKVGFVYMLQGGTASNNLDPYLPAPADGKWLEDGPHVMITNAPDMMKLYPTGAKPDPTQPYVMFPDTPYAHLMIPVK